MTLLAEPADTAPTLAPAPARPTTRRRSRRPVSPWLLPAVAVAVQVYFLAIADRTSPSLNLVLLQLPGRTALPLIGLLGTAAVVLVVNTRARTALDPASLALTALLSITIAFPIAHLPHDRATGYAFVLSAAGLTWSALRRRPLRRALPLAAPGGVLLVVLFVGCVLSPDAGAVQQLLLITSAALPMYLLPQLDGRDRLPDLTRVLVALAGTQSVVALLEPVVWPQHLWSTTPVADLTGGLTRPLINTVLPGVERSQGTLGHPLPLGLLLVVTIALLLRVRTGLPPWARTALLGLFLAGVVVAGDRNALLIALGLLVWGGRLRAVRVLAGLLALSFGVLALAAAGVLSVAFVDELRQSGSYLHRAQAYHVLGGLLYDQTYAQVFFGNGFASTPRMFALGRLQNDGLQVVDNQYVLTQSQGGLVCLAALVTLVGAAVVRARRQLRPAALAVALVMLIFDYMLWTSATALLFLVVGLCLAPRRDTAAVSSR